MKNFLYYLFCTKGIKDLLFVAIVSVHDQYALLAYYSEATTNILLVLSSGIYHGIRKSGYTD